MTTLYFENKEQLAIFKCELLGQFSDGHWENSRLTQRGAWRLYRDAELVVDGSKISLNSCSYRISAFPTSVKGYQKSGYNINWVRRVCAYACFADAVVLDDCYYGEYLAEYIFSEGKIEKKDWWKEEEYEKTIKVFHDLYGSDEDIINRAANYKYQTVDDALKLLRKVGKVVNSN